MRDFRLSSIFSDPSDFGLRNRSISFRMRSIVGTLANGVEYFVTIGPYQ